MCTLVLIFKKLVNKHENILSYIPTPYNTCYLTSLFTTECFLLNESFFTYRIIFSISRTSLNSNIWDKLPRSNFPGHFQKTQTLNPDNTNMKSKTQTMFLESSNHEPSPSYHPMTLELCYKWWGQQEGEAEHWIGRSWESELEIYKLESWFCYVS